MALKTTLWDPSEYLDSPESIAAYLEAAFEDGDPALVAAALGRISLNISCGAICCALAFAVLFVR